MPFTHIQITPVPGNMEEVITEGSEYNVRVAAEMKLALAAPAMQDALKIIGHIVTYHVPSEKAFESIKNVIEKALAETK